MPWWICVRPPLNVGCKKMNDQDNTKFIAVFQPRTSVQSGMIREALEQADITCYVDNEHFSSVQMGGMSIGAGSMKVMVPEDQTEQAKDIIAGLGIE
ncbi:MAG: DUF2007 domain-containing protein [Kiritimatiellae bacterium]|nr:DUF2007 domain-containing protein [Kiritimatiellia bacterium]